MGPESVRDVAVQVTGDEAAGELRSLVTWLQDEPELRGRTRLASEYGRSGALDASLEILTVALAPGGAGSAFAAAFIAWIRSRRGDVEAELTRPDGSRVRVKAVNVRQMSSAEVAGQISELGALLDADQREAH